VIPVQAAIMNVLSIGAAPGVTVAVFQHGWLGGLLGVSPGPIEPWLPAILFGVIVGLSMDYEIFLVSRIHEQWHDSRDASQSIVDALGSTARVITAAATIMIRVFISFVFGSDRIMKPFGISLASGSRRSRSSRRPSARLLSRTRDPDHPRPTIAPSGRVLRTSAAVAHPRRAIATDSVMFPSPAIEWASVEHTI
jgi:hypothetical protein